MCVLPVGLKVVVWLKWVLLGGDPAAKTSCNDTLALGFTLTKRVLSVLETLTVVTAFVLYSNKTVLFVGIEACGLFIKIWRIQKKKS